MKQALENLVAQALAKLQDSGELRPDLAVEIQIERTRDRRHGDFACNIALVLARQAGKKPRELAERITAALPAAPAIARVEVAGPGFINFHLAPEAYHQVARDILEAGEAYGRSTLGHGRRVQVEFVSANPTGPLHVGHGRGAAYGAAVANLLVAVGYQVHREYYVNDAGRQMDILAVSLWLRYLQRCGEQLPFPANGYQGQYVIDIATALYELHGERLRRPAHEVASGLPPDEPDGGDKERHIDALIERTRTLLGEADYRLVFDFGLQAILDDIREDLEEFGVVYEEWYSERSLVERGLVRRAIERLKQGGYLYERDGAWWFRSTQFGDEKDRVVIRDNGQATYFAHDIAYHMDKMERGFERVIDIWGADHHGYVPRIKAALAALGDDPQRLDVLLVQFASLWRGGQKIPMSTRAGQFVTLRELRREVGNDAARFFYVMRKCEQHMDFDLDLAKSQTSDNPVYYIQYAHARICSVMRQLAEKGLTWNQEQGLAHLRQLVEPHEQELLMTLSRYPEVIESAALAHEPHQLAHYLRELAHAFHTYYNAHPFIVEHAALRDARLALVLATRQVLANGLRILGVSAPETM